MLGILRAAGHHVRGAASFGEATHLLATFAPDLVIADERLHAYNGMHVLLRARWENPHVGAIVVTAEKTCAVEADAKRLNMEYAVRPDDPQEWIEFVSRWFHTDHSDGSATADRKEPIPKH